MTNLPTSEQSGDLDNLAVTRAEFRADIGVFLEFVAQALGGVTGNYTTQAINPAAPILQGTPKLEAGATPADDSRDTRIPTTAWVQDHGRYVNSSAPSAPADGMLWVDTSSSPYQLKAYNDGDSQFDVLSGLPAGTRMLFQQKTAPTGWSKVTTGIDNHALRVTTGDPVIVSDQQTFSTIFTTQTISGDVAGHSLTEDQMPSHKHGITNDPHEHTSGEASKSLTGSHAVGVPYTLRATGIFTDSGRPGNIREGADTDNGRTISINANHTHTAGETTVTSDIQNTGSGDSHTHGFDGTNLNLAINYVDVIVAQKN